METKQNKHCIHYVLTLIHALVYCLRLTALVYI